uniref:Uncharacterized protein n=1 Tax=Anguilla anguilla TaxID=7936 RepID=A0A0E9V7R5_ANGAN
MEKFIFTGQRLEKHRFSSYQMVSSCIPSILLPS